MPGLTAEEILDKVQEMKVESAEKDQVITEQQRQIQELEAKVAESESKIEMLTDSAAKADHLFGKISEVLA